MIPLSREKLRELPIPYNPIAIHKMFNISYPRFARFLPRKVVEIYISFRTEGIEQFRVTNPVRIQVGIGITSVG